MAENEVRPPTPTSRAHCRGHGRNQINPLPRDQVQDGGTFTWPIGSMPANFNYHHLDGTESDTRTSKLALMPSAYLEPTAGGTPVWNRTIWRRSRRW